MRLLLDTHTILWYIFGDTRLSIRARELILKTDEIYWSMVSIWEMGIKQSIGKPDFQLPANWSQYIPSEMSRQGLSLLDIRPSHCNTVSVLPWHHRDPFDRLLIATAQTENLTIISRDSHFKSYDVEIIW